MSTGYTAVQWSRSKIIYDVVLVASVLTFLVTFWTIGALTHPPRDRPDWIDLRIRAFGCCALTMLTFILAIGPLARLEPRLLPVLVNRRHFGVLTFAVAALHATFMLEWYIVRDALPTLLPELLNWPDWAKFIGFPFKVLGLLALTILFVMAATSHDFWLKFLGPRAWKFLHMSIYVAYGLVVMHVALGPMQWDRSPLIPSLLATGLTFVAGMHVTTGWRERKSLASHPLSSDGWIVVGPALAIPNQAAVVVTPANGERIAVFRDGDQVAAVTNVCAHQMGPLGEGKVIDGCITCPWHGWQYRLADGRAPAPFTEKIITHRVRMVAGNVEVDPRPLPPGTPAALNLTPA